MKKISKLLSIAAAITSLVFAGCSMMDSASVSDSNDTPPSNMIILTGSVVDAAAGTRTITPAVDNQNYKYYLTGKTNTNVQYKDATDPALEVTEITLNTGKFELPITSAAWELTLVAVDAALSAPTSAANITENASLVAYAYADLLKSNAEVDFTLTPNNLTGKGTVSLTLYLSNKGETTTDLWELPAGYSVEVEVQDFIKGSVLDWAETTDTTASGITFDDDSGSLTTKSKATTVYGDGKKLDPGTYNLVVTFKKTGIPDSVWSDTLVILPKKDTVQDVCIPNLLGHLPADVSELRAWWVEDSEDLPERSGYYLTHFEWDAKDVLNERYFELEIGEIPAACSSDDFSDSDKWASAGVSSYRLYATEGTTEPVSDSPRTMVELRKYADYYDGSLNANNTFCTVYLPLGKAFTARIRAVNGIGVSENWKYLELNANYSPIPTAVAGGQVIQTSWKKNLTSTKTNKVPKGFNEKSDGSGTTAAKAINRFRITYNLNGGKYATGTSGGGAEVFSNKDVVEYYNLTSFATRKCIPLWPANANSTLTALTNSGAKFTSWAEKVNPEEDDKVYKPIDAETVADAGKGGTLKAVANKYAQTSDGSSTKGIAKIKELFSAAVPARTGVEALDDGGYIGFDNLLLYADYSASLDATITKEDFTENFALYTDWVKIASGATTATGVIGTDGKVIGAGTTKTSASAEGKLPNTTGYVVISKSKEFNDPDTDKVVKLHFSIDLPEPYDPAVATSGYFIDMDQLLPTPTDTADVKQCELDGATETAVVSFKVEDAQKKGMANGSTTLTGGAGDLDVFDVTGWENGAYTAYINMTTMKTNARPITTSVRVTIELID